MGHSGDFPCNTALFGARCHRMIPENPEKLMIQAHAQFSSSCRGRHLIVPLAVKVSGVGKHGGKGTKSSFHSFED